MIRTIAPAIIIAVTLLGIAFFAYRVATTAIKNQAIDGCLVTARATLPFQGNGTITTPENYWYTYCMKQKGYK